MDGFPSINCLHSILPEMVQDKIPRSWPATRTTEVDKIPGAKSSSDFGGRLNFKCSSSGGDLSSYFCPIYCTLWLPLGLGEGEGKLVFLCLKIMKKKLDIF